MKRHTVALFGSALLAGIACGCKGKVMPDGHVEHHRTISNRKPEEIRNLVRWVLAQ